MAVTSETSSVEYAGNGVTTAFPTSFRFLKNSEVVVKQKTGTGAYVTKVEGVDYTLTGAGDAGGGTVTMTVAPPNGDTLRIERTVPFTQPTAFTAQGTFSPQVHEDQFDELVFQTQQLHRRVQTLEAQGNNVGDAVAGAGLSVSGNTWNVGAGAGIQVNADDVAVIFGAAADLANVSKSAEAAGVLDKAARADHKHDVDTAAPAAGSVAIGNAAAEGTSTALARADHVHPVPAPAAPVNVTKAAASAGTSTNFARQDHKHDVDTAAPVSVGTANAEGTATTLARSDHVHNHGAQTDPTHHAVATTSANGFMSAADKQKLDNVADATFAGSVQTTNLTPAVVASYTVPERSCAVLEVHISAVRNTYAEAAGYVLVGTFRRGAGVAPLQVGSTTVLATHEDVAGWNVALAVVGNDVQVQVVGSDATIQWRALGRVTLASI